ncbi:hypothetical protein NIES4073_45360 [Kalymmatonema gypsitolerans NIES-4073]|nr:hypothetical protein NIES4073_45360 [Scytonema sp. NIES-4073]
MVLVEDRRLLKDPMHKAQLQEEDILMVARQLQGLESKIKNGSN